MSGETYDKIENGTSLRQTLKGFIAHESFGGILLFFCVVIAMVIANSHFKNIYFDIWHHYIDFKVGPLVLAHISIIHFINDVLMSLFFLMVGLEMKREVLYGELAGFKAVSFSVFGAIGGLVLPSVIYIFFNHGTPSAEGFGVAMSTDTAFALGVILLLGKRIPPVIKIFLVTLAVADDLGAIIVIAVFYTEAINMEWIYVAIVLLVILIIFNYLDIKYISAYLVIGVILWFAIFFSGIHATIAAVLVAFIIPGKSQVSRNSYLKLKEAYNKLYFSTRASAESFNVLEIQRSNIFARIVFGIGDFFKGAYKNIKNFISPKSDAQREVDMHEEHKRVELLDTISRYSKYAQNPLVRIEYILQPLNAYFVVPLFAFANAGVTVGAGLDFHIDGILLGTILGLVIGKPIGIFLFTIFSEKIGLAKRPEGLSNSHILSVGLLAGIGFTMSMFVANLAYKTNVEAIDLSKISILIASAIAAVVGVIGLTLSTSKKSNIKEEEL
ncbi:Na+/H+ antiporter NhaA [Helicobacter sp. 13S00401-1]|uniref:Na+/H+ antiporter NhaA n=1 Tax=Helicobacter sp. 13S00401-1 TaxID=1905758 RepID=UPI000BA73DC6|nr:Na+/H+ antiporter NhaA [Helicobacter sp. 13S00401-1]PAF50204.1 Na+/H+ antiporter NhaA [Helicobacter sp. 13S00401-1]